MILKFKNKMYNESINNFDSIDELGYEVDGVMADAIESSKKKDKHVKDVMKDSKKIAKQVAKDTNADADISSLSESIFGDPYVTDHLEELQRENILPDYLEDELEEELNYGAYKVKMFKDSMYTECIGQESFDRNSDAQKFLSECVDNNIYTEYMGQRYSPFSLNESLLKEGRTGGPPIEDPFDLIYNELSFDATTNQEKAARRISTKDFPNKVRFRFDETKNGDVTAKLDLQGDFFILDVSEPVRLEFANRVVDAYPEFDLKLEVNGGKARLYYPE